MSKQHEDSSVSTMGGVTLGYLSLMAGSGLFLWFVNLFWGDKILPTIDELWGSGVISIDGLGRVWFIFVWGFVATLLIGLLLRSSTLSSSRTVAVLKGWWVSLNAGVFEEIIFRWMIFFSSMVVLTFLSWITFGLVKWFYTHALIPLANFTTFHALESQLYDPRSWLIGAAIVMASVKFRNAHEHLGLIGWVNSWFGGMVMFWLMFNFGLLTAIVAHVVYDMIVFTTSALTAEKKRY